MEEIYANDFFDIIVIVNKNALIKDKIVELINLKNIAGKVIEEKKRELILKKILINLINNKISSLEEAYKITETELNQQSSKYKFDKNVFKTGWAERLIRTQLSRFYNQAVLEILIKKGEINCYIPHSKFEKSDSNCSKFLSNSSQNVKILLERLVKNYEDGNWDNQLKIPNHPHCTHVIMPLKKE